MACDQLLLACGQWTKQLAASIGAVVPTASLPHQYVVFDKIESADGAAAVSNRLPVLRDFESKIYARAAALELAA